MPQPQPQNNVLIDSAEALDELAKHLRRCGRFAFDTEFVSEHTFEPVLCLIQVATRERLVLVDALAIGDVRPFWAAVTDPAVEVVMHAAGEDLRICRLQTGALPQRLFDAQIAAGLASFAYPLSLGNLVYQVLGVSLAGGETRTDWRKRPLSAAQLRYALDDVRHLLDLADQLHARLAALQRTAWAESEMQSFLEQLQSRADEERWRRLPGLHQLNRRGLEVARRLVDWRIEVARHTNRPLRQVLRDDLIIAIGKRLPTDRRDLEALRDFSRPNLQRRSQEIVDLVARAMEVPAAELPEHGQRREEAAGLSMLVSLLAAAMNRCCAQHKVAVGLLGTTTDLKDLVRWHTEGCPETYRPALATGWRAEVCGQTLLEVLSGHVALRVADPTADVPVALERLGVKAPDEPTPEPDTP